jgi:predicted secreted protein
MSLIFAFILTTFVAQEKPVQPSIPIEVFQVIELPLTITDTALVKTKGGYFLKCQISSNSEFRTLGVRYALAVVNSMNVTTTIINRNEGVKLAANQTKTLTFKTPIKLRLKADERLVLMFEQVITTDYVWEVMKAKEALAAYIAGDYSVAPRVLRVSNQVDAPIPGRIY